MDQESTNSLKMYQLRLLLIKLASVLTTLDLKFVMILATLWLSEKQEQPSHLMPNWLVFALVAPTFILSILYS